MTLTEAELIRLSVLEVHEKREGADGSVYCDLCSNHGDVHWPCATVEAMDQAVVEAQALQ